jgi:parvulin-like peptidyl-prolyl isomerase
MPNEVPAARRSILLVAAALSGIGCTRRPAAAAPPLPPPVSSEVREETWQNRRDRRSDPAPAPAPAAQPHAPPADQVVARVNGHEITLRQLQQPLVEGYGLTVLLNLVQLELAKQRARELNVTITPDDLTTERDLTLARLFPSAEKGEYDALFEQFLQQQRITRPEFDIVLQTNAHLRKIMAPQVTGKLTEDNLRQAYNEVYGETVRVRHIQVANMTEVAEAKRRLADGEPFERVAEAMSRNSRTRTLGGELPPFSRASNQYPQAFRDAAFLLKPGEVSDPVQAEGSLHLIKLEQRIQPKAVKFEDVKESLRKDLEEKLVQQGMNQLRNQIGQDALKSLKIEEPTLHAQYQRRLDARDADVRDRDLIRQQIEKQNRQRQQDAEDAAPSTTQPGGTAPTTAPTTAPGVPPATAPAATRAPTTQP